MGLFSRRHHPEPELTQPGQDQQDQGSGLPVPEPVEPGRGGGPWDVAEAPSRPEGWIDLGALQVPAVDGMQLRLDAPDPDGQVPAVVLVLGGSSLELRAFAAPRTEGLWEDLRRDIAAELSDAGASYTLQDGPHGTELLASVPLRTPDGGTASATVRFMGADGPRWFLRGVLQGPAATDPDAATALREVFDGIVVVRGHEARPPRELLPLRVPGSSRLEREDLPGVPDLAGPAATEEA